MRAVTVTIGGKKQYLLFTVAAMFELREKYGEATDIIEKLQPDSLESFEMACEVISILAENGELARRQMGYSKEEIITADAIKRTVQPKDLSDLKMMVPRVIALGFGREIDPDSEDEVDLGLLELNQKKTT